MDREVAGGYFDYKMVIPDFRFSNFKRNIPQEEASLDSRRSSNVSLNDDNEDADRPLNTIEEGL